MTVFMVRRAFIVSIAVTLAAVLAWGCMYGFALRERSRAEACLRDIIQLRLGTATFADAQRIASEFGGSAWDGPSRRPDCSPQRCRLIFIFRNRPFGNLVGVGVVELVAGIAVEDGHIVGREVDYSLRSTQGYRVLYLVSDKLSPAEQGFEVKRLGGTGVGEAIKVTLGPKASAEERNLVYSLDLACLARVFGCAAPSTVFPRGLRVAAAEP